MPSPHDPNVPTCKEVSVTALLGRSWAECPQRWTLSRVTLPGDQDEVGGREGTGGSGWRCPLSVSPILLYVLFMPPTSPPAQAAPPENSRGAGGWGGFYPQRWETLYVTWTWEGGPGWGAGCGSSTSLQEFLATLSLLSAPPPQHPPAPPSTRQHPARALPLPAPACASIQAATHHPPSSPRGSPSLAFSSAWTHTPWLSHCYDGNCCWF